MVSALPFALTIARLHGWCISPSWFARCFAYEKFSKRRQLLTKKFVLQGYNESCLKPSFRKFYGCYNYIVCNYKSSLDHIMICFIPLVRLSFPCWLWRRVIPYTNFDWGRTTDMTGHQRMLTPPWHLILTSLLSASTCWICFLDYYNV
jgi:hypothetical protein